jgi:hypothetical protein
MPPAGCAKRRPWLGVADSTGGGRRRRMPRRTAADGAPAHAGKQEAGEMKRHRDAGLIRSGSRCRWCAVGLLGQGRSGRSAAFGMPIRPRRGGGLAPVALDGREAPFHGRLGGNHLAPPDDFLAGGKQHEVGLTLGGGPAFAVGVRRGIGLDGIDPGQSAGLIAVGFAGEDVLVIGRGQVEVELAVGGLAKDEGRCYETPLSVDSPAGAAGNRRRVVLADMPGMSRLASFPPISSPVPGAEG